MLYIACGVVLLVVGYIGGIEARSIGFSTIRLDVVVRDASSKLPVEGAVIRILNQDTLPWERIELNTDYKGEAHCVCKVTVLGTDSWFTHLARIGTRRVRLIVTASDYERQESTLANASGQSVLDCHGTRSLTASIGLRRRR